jgi:hypothetical protein
VTYIQAPVRIRLRVTQRFYSIPGKGIKMAKMTRRAVLDCSHMRFLGVVLFVMGCGGVGYCVKGALTRKRPADVLFAVLAPLGAIAALLGLGLLFVPDFLG